MSLSQKTESALIPQKKLLHRSRLRNQAKGLLNRQKAGHHLDNTQKRIVVRWQRLEAQMRAAEQGRVVA